MVAFSNFLRLIGALIVCSIVGYQRAPQILADEAAQRGLPAARARAVIAVVRSDRESYMLGDTVKLDFSLQNTGHERVHVDRRMFWGGLAGGLKLLINDESGKPVPFPGLLNDALMPPPKQGDAFILIPLDPGFSYGTTSRLPVADHFRQAGRYSIQVIYQSRLPEYLVLPRLRELPALWEDTPAIASERIWISVTN